MTNDNLEQLLAHYQADETVPEEFKHAYLCELKGLSRSFNETTVGTVAFFITSATAAQLESPIVTWLSFAAGCVFGLYAFIVSRLHNDHVQHLQKYSTNRHSLRLE